MVWPYQTKIRIRKIVSICQDEITPTHQDQKLFVWNKGLFYFRSYRMTPLIMSYRSRLSTSVDKRMSSSFAIKYLSSKRKRRYFSKNQIICFAYLSLLLIGTRLNTIKTEEQKEMRNVYLWFNLFCKLQYEMNGKKNGWKAFTTLWLIFTLI